MRRRHHSKDRQTSENENAHRIATIFRCPILSGTNPDRQRAFPIQQLFIGAGLFRHILHSLRFKTSGHRFLRIRAQLQTDGIVSCAPILLLSPG